MTDFFVSGTKRWGGFWLVMLRYVGLAVFSATQAWLFALGKDKWRAMFDDPFEMSYEFLALFLAIGISSSTAIGALMNSKYQAVKDNGKEPQL